MGRLDGRVGLVASTVIVLSNLAAVAVDFFYILLGQALGSEQITELSSNTAINIATTWAFMAVAA